MALMSEQRKSLNKNRNFKGKDANTVLEVYKRYNNCEFFLKKKNYAVSLRANWRRQRVGEPADRLIISLISPFILFALALCLENFLTPVKKAWCLNTAQKWGWRKREMAHASNGHSQMGWLKWQGTHGEFTTPNISNTVKSTDLKIPKAYNSPPTTKQ